VFVGWGEVGCIFSRERVCAGRECVRAYAPSVRHGELVLALHALLCLLVLDPLRLWHELESPVRVCDTAHMARARLVWLWCGVARE
jgi:hypothetical protein